MRMWFGWLMVSLTLVVIASYAWTHRRHVAVPAVAAVPTPEREQRSEEEKAAEQMVTVTGPMADYMQRQTPSGVMTLAPIPHQPHASDHVADSPVGTGIPLLHKTFSVAKAADLPFEIPAHAATPRLHGTYRSFLQQAGAQSSDATADVEFLVLNEKQFADFLGGRSGDALFSAEDAHDQEVNTSLPPTIDHPAKYYLVFRNNSGGKGKKFVQADFRIDF